MLNGAKTTLISISTATFPFNFGSAGWKSSEINFNEHNRHIVVACDNFLILLRSRTQFNLISHLDAHFLLPGLRDSIFPKAVTIEADDENSLFHEEIIRDWRIAIKRNSSSESKFLMIFISKFYIKKSSISSFFNWFDANLRTFTPQLFKCATLKLIHNFNVNLWPLGVKLTLHFWLAQPRGIWWRQSHV